MVLVMVCGAGMMACQSTSPDLAPATLRVMTWNIRHGEGLDGRVDLERIAAVIRASGADLVGLQEVDRGVRRTGGVDMPAELARLTGLAASVRNRPFSSSTINGGASVIERMAAANIAKVLV